MHLIDTFFNNLLQIIVFKISTQYTNTQTREPGAEEIPQKGQRTEAG